MVNFDFAVLPHVALKYHWIQQAGINQLIVPIRFNAGKLATFPGKLQHLQRKKANLLLNSYILTPGGNYYVLKDKSFKRVGLPFLRRALFFPLYIKKA